MQGKWHKSGKNLAFGRVFFEGNNLIIKDFTPF